jgi:anhydro-N-acetylmuramic acid kinase
MASYFLGLISGTSVDGVDAALCEFGNHKCEVFKARTFAYPPAIKARIEALIGAQQARLDEVGAIDIAAGRFFADCALALIKSSGLETAAVRAIGHHGQTIWHQPDSPEPFSWQIGDPNSVAAITGIDTVADLRRLDMAVGGQGAPIVPAFHRWLFSSDEQPRIILNIGGIANLTVLAPGREILGFDTGPGNTLMDAWAREKLDRPFDEDGRWAASGRVDHQLLEAMLDDAYFSRETPKSTGRERFNETWLKQKLANTDRRSADADVAATLLELSASTIASEIERLELQNFDLIACGGGTRNSALMDRIGALTNTRPKTTAEFGLHPDWVEAAAMAWLARARLELKPGNVATVTAAREAVVLGGLYLGIGNTD